MSHQCTMTEPTCSSGVDIRDSENNQNENVNDGDENNEGQNKVPMGKGKYVAAPKNIEIEMRKRKKTRICSKITGGQKTKHKKDKGNYKITLTNNSSAEAKAHKETGFTTETAPHEINLHDEFKQSEQEEDSGQSQLHGSGKSEDRISDSPERAMNNRTQEEPLETPQDTTKRKPNKIFISGDHYGKKIPTVLKTIEGQYHRLKSRHPAIRSALESDENFHATNKWITIWAETAGDHFIQLDYPTQCFKGSDLPHRLWSKLNRVRTGCGKCADSLHKWGRAESPQCDCGSPRQTIRHIISECPNRSYDYDLEDFMKATPEAIEWLRNLDVDI
ncbi:hypothetical protein JTB14_017930 [Gonioctena quinquepunctata]|nr:hypothetical protein JTB14_017930 [Gonioctena quinquepunctata]